ncbi:MAG: hypothetical protein BAJALOKI3v1_820014 [Promethearchaeota archaeon]|jgi:hypothetical protein|nr:MAG: hypothetical protein BAJALOKI3v1_820014 [Candidatus Lokiarchaeota archaeon]
MKDVINSTQICHFLDDVEHNFPNFVAAVISDSDGLPIGSKIPKGFQYQENILALEAITRNKGFLENSNYIKVKVALNEDKSVRLLLLLNKPKNYLNGFKNLKRIVQRQMLF